MKNILVTGGLGILGRSISIKLSKNSRYKIYILDKDNSKKKIKTLIFKSNVKIIIGDFTHKKVISKIIKDYNINDVIHLGATTQVLEAFNKPDLTYKNNLFGTINILECIRKSKKNINLIYSSSDKAYGELKKKEYFENFPLKGDFTYDVSKSSSDLIAQSYAKTYKISVGIIRSGNIYGPGDFNMDRLIPHVIISCLKNKKPILRSNGKLIRDYIYVEDVAKAYISLMQYMNKSEEKLKIYNVGSKENLMVIDLVNIILNILNKNNLKPKIKNISTVEIKKQKLNYRKIKKELNWEPKVNIYDGIKETVKWYKKYLKLFNL